MLKCVNKFLENIYPCTFQVKLEEIWSLQAALPSLIQCGKENWTIAEDDRYSFLH